MPNSKSLRRKRVKSEAVRSMGYDERNWLLQVEYTNGKLYNYFNVPPWENAGLEAAESIGGYLNLRIKPAYKYEEVVAEASGA